MRRTRNGELRQKGERMAACVWKKRKKSMANCVKKGQKEEQIASQIEIELRKKKGELRSDRAYNVA